MHKIKKSILIMSLILGWIIPYATNTLAAIELENGQPSQIRELILKQKQEKKRLLLEKYKKEQQEKKESLISKEKITTTQKPSPSFTKLQFLLITGLFLLTMLTITLGFVTHYRRQKK